MRVVPAYLWAVWREVRESAGHLNLALGVLWGLIFAVVRTGVLPLSQDVLVMIQDVATWTLLLFFAVQFLFIVPARLWERGHRDEGDAGKTFHAGSVNIESMVVIQAPGQLPIFQPQDIPPATPRDDDLTDTATVSDPPVSREEPQSPPRSTHD